MFHPRAFEFRLHLGLILVVLQSGCTADETVEQRPDLLPTEAETAGVEEFCDRAVLSRGDPLTCDEAPELCNAAREVVMETTWMGPAIELVFLPEGVTQDRMDAWRERVGVLTDGLVSTPPFDSFRERLRILRLDIASSTSKVTNAERNDTAFGSCVLAVTNWWPDEPDKRRIDLAIRANVPSAIVAIVVVARSGQQGGGSVRGDNFMNTITIQWNSPAESLMHELGHALFGLGDEYARPDRDRCRPAPSFAASTGEVVFSLPNLTTDANGTPWRDVIIGAELGGGGFPCGVFNPPGPCRMQERINDFCAVCQHAIQSVLVAQEGRDDGPPRCEFAWKVGAGLAASEPKNSVFVYGAFRDANGLRAWDLTLDGVPVAKNQPDGGFHRSWFGHLSAVVEGIEPGRHTLGLRCVDAVGSESNRELPLDL